LQNLIVAEYNNRLEEHEKAVAASNNWLAKAREVDKLLSIEQRRKDLMAESERLTTDISRLESELSELPDTTLEGIEVEVEGLQIAIDDAQQILDKLTGSLKRWERIKINQDMLSDFEKGLASASNGLKAVRKAKVQIIDKALLDITKNATTLLNSIGISGTVIAKLDKGSIRLGLELDGQYIDFTALS